MPRRHYYPGYAPGTALAAERNARKREEYAARVDGLAANPRRPPVLAAAGGVHRHHPATAEDLEYTAAQAEFLVAVDRYRTRTGHTFPTLCELLSVLESLGYARPPADLRP